ncbi:MAG: acyltransferase [Rhodocyclaceae bacterium]
MRVYGYPETVDTFPGVGELGDSVRIADSVSIYLLSHDTSAISIGAGSVLHEGVRLVVGDPRQHENTSLRIGRRVHVNVHAYLSGEGGLLIDDDVLIGPHARLLSAGHQIDDGTPVISEAPLTFGRVQVKQGAWIGAGATVLEGVCIGTGAVVAAGAVVTRDVPPFAVVAGIPARIVRFRNGMASIESPRAEFVDRNGWLSRFFRRCGLGKQ